MTVMESSIRTLLAMLAGISGIGAVYFLCLSSGMPFSVCSALLAVAIIVLLSYLRFLNLGQPNGSYHWSTIAILLAGVFLITNRCYYLALPWGEWDAWSMWNYHARILTNDTQWTNLFRSTQYDHPDYPLCLPASIAFITRLLGKQHLMQVSFGLSFFITLAIPVLVFLSLRAKNIWIAAGVLALFATDDCYLTRGVAQFADTLIGAFFLAAILLIKEAKRDRRLLLPAAFFIVSTAWVKNEGIVLSLIFLLFYGRAFFSRYGLKCFMAGAALPGVALLVLKLRYAPPSDLLYNHSDLLEQLMDGHRYTLVWQYFCQFNRDCFLQLIGLLLLYLAVNLYLRRTPQKSLWLVFVCLCSYMLTYILTPYDPEWQLRTSLGRLMHQLMPATMFVLGDGLCELRLPGFLKNAA